VMESPCHADRCDRHNLRIARRTASTAAFEFHTAAGELQKPLYSGIEMLSVRSREYQENNPCAR
jgi:hypothetical protein